MCKENRDIFWFPLIPWHKNANLRMKKKHWNTSTTHPIKFVFEDKVKFWSSILDFCLKLTLQDVTTVLNCQKIIQLSVFKDLTCVGSRFGATTLGIMTCSITTLSITSTSAMLSINCDDQNDTQHKVFMSVKFVCWSLIVYFHHVKWGYIEWCYSLWHFVEYNQEFIVLFLGVS